MILPVLTEPNKILRRVGDKLTMADLTTPKMKKFITDLTETMYAKDGVGIASPQVGNSIQLCVIAKNFTPDKKRDLVLVNPAWKKTTTKTAWDMEGCLSVPGIYGEVKRYTEIKVTALSETGAPLQFKANKFFCRIIQHEVDHLNGILFIDKARNLQEIDKKTDTI
ncbi:MAG: peptide deformylase [Candidatus Magasanikbacteria bacterium RIFOXYC2_FULL_42_28]|uniref:Peptide deformylase n=1 Tax=Candidatus Magasanikbacteria bacterium RIFOXYC2_FULL_42_28 TaxID=1798704 RepID=A0A1F6NXD6_9BACT|nr:MAG: peptide deformylase [Candidatus Magasanikbacteria bacterium RIFOXYC2_FULL_42_28]